MATVMKTPGVYVVEKDAFPSSVVEVATAVPAFIGYTEKHLNKEQSLLFQPRRITSLTEFEQYFGGPPSLAASFTITAKAPKALDDKRTMAVMAGPRDPVVRQDKAEYYLARTDASRRYHLYYGLKSFYQNGGGPCFIVSIGKYADDETPNPDHFTKGIDALLKEQEPTMLVFPDAVLMSAADCKTVQEAAVSHCTATQSRFAILDVHRGFLARDAEGQRDCITDFREIAADEAKYAAAYYPWIETTVVPESDPQLTYKTFDDDGLKALQSIVTKELVDTEENAAKKAGLQKLVQDMADPKAAIVATNNALRVLSPSFKEIMRQVQGELNRIPPSATMAGVYTAVDNNRGVWKAPANVGLKGVVKPTVNISHDQQQDLNVSVTGKSVNAIRSFVGEGTLVWGARTLDGNSLDWRYVNVRRTLIMLEQSIKLASKAYVFEGNDANTWVTMKSMIRNFLTGIWKRGGLAGTSPDDAFSVHVGLGETMTAEDILEGILRVTVLVALIRPAEFIEITFQQQMQKS
jgi:Bacteriophage tail sheath protein